jgi:nucleotide-binding universal stress UspA family protein
MRERIWYKGHGGVVSRVLAILTPARREDALLEEAIRVAKTEGDDAHLVALYVIDKSRAAHLRDCLNNRGFVGPGPAEDVSKLSDDSALLEGQAAIEDVRELAQTHGIGCDAEVIWGELLETVLEAAQEQQADRVFMSQSKLGLFARLFGEKDHRKLKRRLGERLVVLESQDEPL